MISIRKSPFRRDENEKLLMIEEVAREAVRLGSPLTDEERKLLASDIQGARLPARTEARLMELVGNIMKRQAIDREWERNPRCFTAAIEWAGDQDHPYVVQLAEQAVKDQALTLPRNTVLGSKFLFYLVIAIGAVVFAILISMLLIILAAEQ